jgi:hypothetical protein
VSRNAINVFKWQRECGIGYAEKKYEKEDLDRKKGLVGNVAGDGMSATISG